MRKIQRVIALVAFTGALLLAPLTHAAKKLKMNATPTKATLPMTDIRPLYFEEVVLFDTDDHRSLRLPSQHSAFPHAVTSNLVPLTFAEAGLALRDMPIVFITETDPSTPSLVAIVSLTPNTNVFIDAQGRWRPGAYVPAYVRGYPFIALRVKGNNEPMLAFDPTAAAFNAAEGQPLVGDDGKPSAQLQAIMAFHNEYQQIAERTRIMAKALMEAGVLEDGTFTLKPIDGGEAKQISGFKTINEAKLKALPAAELKKLIDVDALGLAYAQIFSMASLPHLMAAPTAATAPAAAGTH